MYKYYLTNNWEVGDKGVLTLLRSISLKLYITVQLEFKLAY